VSGLLSRYCDVHTVSDGAEALAELQKRRMDYDLVLSDDMMPNMTVSVYLFVPLIFSVLMAHSIARAPSYSTLFVPMPLCGRSHSS
jgi:hypothetical protein